MREQTSDEYLAGLVKDATAPLTFKEAMIGLAVIGGLCVIVGGIGGGILYLASLIF